MVEKRVKKDINYSKMLEEEDKIGFKRKNNCSIAIKGSSGQSSASPTFKRVGKSWLFMFIQTHFIECP